ncbi:MAG TPA: PfkB family carbohydrate kinase [Pseudonocardia sp.]|nr:PfkB family carbohydrate kinase [Pseudonocardia sp.]
MSPYDVLVLGEPLLERHADAAGGRTAPDAVSGDAFNAACAAALAGARVALLTALGRDEAGERVMAELERRGIGTEHVHRDDRPTGAYTIAPDSQGRPAFTYQRAGSAAASLEPGHLARWRPAVEATPVLVTGGVCAALSTGTDALVRAAAAAAHGAGRAVCYDVNFRPRLTTPEAALTALRAVAPHCRVVKIATPGDAEPLLGRIAATEVIAALRELTGAAVIVTDGENPLTLHEGGTSTRFTTVPAPGFVDATGAGDVLLGTLAAALSRGAGPAAALPEAMAAAALSTGHRGGAPHATRDEVRALLAGRG